MGGVDGISKSSSNLGKSAWTTSPGASADSGALDFTSFLHQAMEEKAASLSAKGKNDEKLREAARELEAIFVQQMITAMRTTVPEGDGMFAKSSTEKTFESMLDVEYAKVFAGNAGFGFAEAIYRQLSEYVAKDE